MHADDSQRNPIEVLAEEFASRFQSGDSPSVSEYVQRYPQYADDIEELFPSILMMERMRMEEEGEREEESRQFRENRKLLKRIGDFEILREVGRGGMGIVYEAVERALRRRVAIKVLGAGSLSSTEHVARFQREAQAAAGLHHTSIVPVFGVGEQDELNYYVMQFIDGHSLDNVLSIWHDSRNISLEDTAVQSITSTDEAVPLEMDSDRPQALVTGESLYQNWRRIADIGSQIASALGHAHGQGVLHRDVKPANLMLDHRGCVWITDFGLAKLLEQDDLTKSANIVGTLRYMAPEQLNGECDVRSDLYGLGATLYELLTYCPAYDEQDRGRLLRQRAECEPVAPRKVNPGVPRDLETIVLKAMSRDPAHRYQSANDMEDDLQRFLDEIPIKARPVSAFERCWRWSRRNPLVASWAGIAVALLVLVAVISTTALIHSNRLLEREETQRTRAETERDRAEQNLNIAREAFEKISNQLAYGISQTDDNRLPNNPRFFTTVNENTAAALETLRDFYDRFAEQNQDSEDLQFETAKAYQRVGDIQRQLGEYAEAERAYRQSLASLQQLSECEETPLSLAELKSMQAALHVEIGMLCQLTGRFTEADVAYGTGEKMYHELSANDKNDLASRFAIARVEVYRVDIARLTEDLQNMKLHCDNAITQLQQLVAEDPNNPTYLQFLAIAYKGRHGYAPKEDKAADDAIRILEDLVARYPHVPEYRYDLMQAYSLIFEPNGVFTPRHRMMAMVPTDAASQEKLNRSIQIGRDLVSEFPSVPRFKAALATALRRAGESTSETGSALKHLADAESIFAELIEQFPNIPTYVLEMAATKAVQGHQLRAEGEIEKSVEVLKSAIATQERFVDFSPDSHWAKIRLGMMYHEYARSLKEHGQMESARTALMTGRQFMIDSRSSEFQRMHGPLFGPPPTHRHRPFGSRGGRPPHGPPGRKRHDFSGSRPGNKPIKSN